MGHKLKRIGALAHPLRAEKDEDVVMGAHTLTGVEELLESCFLALENYTGEIGLHILLLDLISYMGRVSDSVSVCVCLCVFPAISVRL